MYLRPQVTVASAEGCMEIFCSIVQYNALGIGSKKGRLLKWRWSILLSV
jgi:hypothetical protein